MYFRDRQDAGRRLAERIAGDFAGDDTIVLGLPRGGVPVAFEIAKALQAPLDVLIVRKIGTPMNPELAAGAIGPRGVAVYNEELLRMIGLDREDLESIKQSEQRELERREAVYRGDRPPLQVEGKTVILVDDGIATGATMSAAVEALRLLGAGRIVVTVPTSSTDACRHLEELADEVIALSTPEPYVAVGAWYENFGQTSDQEVIDLLDLAEETSKKQ